MFNKKNSIMNLETFISESLTQIARGIEKADSNLTDSTAIVSPRRIKPMPKESGVYGGLEEGDGKPSYSRLVESIEFDVAVTVSEGKETKGGIGIMVGSVGLGSQGKSDKEHSAISRLKFRIPFVLPNTEGKSL